VRLSQGWFAVYHGVEVIKKRESVLGLRYSAGAVVMDPADPRRILYRSPTPTLVPELPEECAGVVSNVVFPTAVDQHATYLDIYYGMADRCIGVARMAVPPPVV
jgi:predicted GH43/DUF377 family glycosyl hydrolase